VGREPVPGQHVVGRVDQETADWVDHHYGRLDILVNNAGIARAGGPPSQTDLDAMREVYETNVFGVIIVTNAMLPLLRRAPAARIVNVSSEVGSITSMTDPASPLAQMPASLAYPSSKSALNMITALYAKELRDTPVTVNAANPGYTATDLNGHNGLRSVAEGAEASVHLGHPGHRWPQRNPLGPSVDRRRPERRLRPAPLVSDFHDRRRIFSPGRLKTFRDHGRHRFSERISMIPKDLVPLAVLNPSGS
jgi:NAD(P)-dependent dehydrogenase (short-subunit alcohol dehydrogenase family)